MMDYAVARRNMVEGQLRTNEITDPALVAAVLETPRERFVPPGWESLAYADRPVPLGALAQRDKQRTMVEPLALARLLQAADVHSTDSVLHVACNTGYGTALLVRLGAKVTAIESDPALAAAARANLAALGLAVTVVEGPLAAGLAQSAPYDAIVIEGAVERLPDGFAGQLAPDGRLTAIALDGGAGQVRLYRRAGGHLSGFPRAGAYAPVLEGFERPAEFVF